MIRTGSVNHNSIKNNKCQFIGIMNLQNLTKLQRYNQQLQYEIIRLHCDKVKLEAVTLNF